MASQASSSVGLRLEAAVFARDAAAVSYAHLLEQSGKVKITLILQDSGLGSLAKRSGFRVSRDGHGLTHWRPSRVVEALTEASDKAYNYVLTDGADASRLQELLHPKPGHPSILVALHSTAAMVNSSGLTIQASTTVQASMRSSSDGVELHYSGLERVTLSPSGLQVESSSARTTAAVNELASVFQVAGTQVTVEEHTQGSTWSRASWETATPPNGLHVETTMQSNMGSSAYSPGVAQRRPPHRPGNGSPALLDSPSSVDPPLYESTDYPVPYDGIKMPFIASPIYETTGPSYWSYLPQTLRNLSGAKQRSRADDYAEKGRRRRTGSFTTYLPFYRGGSWRRRGKRKWSTVLYAAVVLGIIFGLLYVKRTYDFQVEISAYSKPWIQREVDEIPELSGCFAPHRVSPQYNLSLHTSPKYHSLSPGISLRRGMSCYDFAASIQSSPHAPLTPLIYHTYWRADLLPFAERQAATLTSFLATQPLSHSRLILWTNGAETLRSNPHVARFLETWPEYVEVRGVDMESLAVGTALEGTGLIGDKVLDKKAWVDGDAVRLLVLWGFGGVWMDMDQILTRDLHPLVEHEFVTQWDCYDKPYLSLNGALMHFRQHSPYLCEAFHIMASSPRPLPNTFTWGALLYAKLHRALLRAHQTPFAVLPWCFADPRNCREDIRFPDPFKPNPEYWGGERWDDQGREVLEQRVSQVWSVHLHNQWDREFPSGGWIDRLLEGYKAQLNALEVFANVGRREKALGSG